MVMIFIFDCVILPKLEGDNLFANGKAQIEEYITVAQNSFKEFLDFGLL